MKKIMTRSKKMPERRKRKPAVSSGKIIENDFEYIEGYSDVCSLILEREKLVKKINDIAKRDFRGCGKSLNLLKQKTSSLSKRIKQKDKAFWLKIDGSLKGDTIFVVEKIASRFDLGHYEKKVMLLFLHLDFCQFDSNERTALEVVSLLDPDSSLADRLKKTRHFSGNGPLIKNRIVRKRDSYSMNRGAYSLGNRARQIVSLALNGDEIDWDKRSDMAVAKPDNVGYEKTPEHTLDTVVVKEEAKSSVRLFLDAFKEDRLEKLGVHEKIKKGRGLTFLFYGPPGTGKSMLAEAVADYVNRKILLVEYPKITSRWLGETDKNISKIFKTAKEKSLVVIMDEADTLLCSRDYASQEHDIRFVNIMLQELENYEGIVILTTNMDTLLDSALERRVALKLKFELPDVKKRSEIWKYHIPDSIELAKNVNFESLSNKYEFSGGNIKNAVLNAARRIAVGKGNILTMGDLVFGAELEREGMFSCRKKREVIGFCSDW